MILVTGIERNDLMLDHQDDCVRRGLYSTRTDVILTDICDIAVGVARGCVGYLYLFDGDEATLLACSSGGNAALADGGPQVPGGSCARRLVEETGKGPGFASVPLWSEGCVVGLLTVRLAETASLPQDREKGILHRLANVAEARVRTEQVLTSAARLYVGAIERNKV